MFLSSVLIFMLSEVHISRFVPPLQLEIKKGDASLNYQNERRLLDIIFRTASTFCLDSVSFRNQHWPSDKRWGNHFSNTASTMQEPGEHTLHREARIDERQIETILHLVTHVSDSLLVTHVSEETLNIFEKCCSLHPFFPLWWSRNQHSSNKILEKGLEGPGSCTSCLLPDTFTPLSRTSLVWTHILS